jgi:signal transduction histidine kinase
MNWDYTYDPHIWPALITLAITITLGLYSWRHRHILAAKPFTIAVLFGALWTLGAILEISAVDFSTKVFWLKFQVVWQLPSATAVLCFVLSYAGLGRFLNLRNILFLALVPLLVVVLIITNDFHHLMWVGFQMNGDVIVSPGRLYWVFIIYVFLAALVNITVLGRLAIRSSGHRWPVAIILSGQILARVGYTLDKLNSGMFGPGESVLLTVGVVSTAYAVAFFGFHAIDPVASARSAVLRQMREGMFVLDLQGRIIDANPVAAEIVGIPENILRKKRLAEALPIDTGTTGQSSNKGIGRSEIILGDGDLVKHYSLNMTPLKDRHGELMGQLLLLNDITDQIHAQAKVIEQQRVVATLEERERLARELHDGIAQVLGYVGIQAQTASKWLQDGDIEKARSLLGRLAEVVKDAHTDVRESILNLRAGSSLDWSFVPTLKRYLENFQTNYGIRTDLSISDGIGLNTLSLEAEVQLLRVIQEALTNARKHSGAHEISVNIEQDTSHARITIIDGGHGFDIDDPRLATRNHFGLVFMRERMEQIGGSLKIDSRPGAGTVVEINTPISDQGGSDEGIAGGR